MAALLNLILQCPEAFDETQVPCCLRAHWLAALESRKAA
jgi:hypothetical protein